MGRSSGKLPSFLFNDSAKGLLVTSKYVLDSLSMWPENQNWFAKFMHCFYLLSSVYFMYGNLYFVFTSTDVGGITYGLTVSGVIIECVIRRILMYAYRGRVNKLLLDVYSLFWPSTINGDEQHKQLGKEARYLLLYCIAYSLSALTATMMYIIMPMSTMNTPYLTSYPFQWRKNPYYSLLYAWEGFCFMETVSTVCSWNMFFASLGYNLVAQFKLLNTHIKQNFLENRGNLAKQKIFVTNCVLHHYTILNSSKELNEILYYFTLSLFLSSIQTCCLSAFVVTAVPELNIFGTFYFLGHACQLFLYCYLGSELALESMELSTTVYMCGWETSGTDKDLRRALGMIMMRSQKPVQLSAGGFGYLHLSSFMKILQFSFSIYTLLNTMAQKGLL
ncbi:hypothetical protein FQR65_LT02184 [Abscondita terminalis]|nr:hypothetical protein FQR65_LT02184 [Abscondita terminalis]